MLKQLWRIPVYASDWYAQDVAAAYEAGLVSGLSETRFAPKNKSQENKWPYFWFSAYDYVRGMNSSMNDNLSDLKDQKQVSSWVKAGVNKAIELGLMKGQSKAVFAPQANAVRAETAQAILNLLNQMENNK